MSCRFHVLVALVALLGAPLTSRAQNLVANGDFDNIGGVWTDNTGYGFDDFQSSGSTAIPDWTNVPGYTEEMWVTSPSSVGISPSPGNGSMYWVDLTGYQNYKPYGGLEQVIATTPGEIYECSFDVGSSTTYNSGAFDPAALTASATGTSQLASQLFTLSPTSTSTWATETFQFTADSSSTTIEFLADSSYSSANVGLDNVRVSSVPEPSDFAPLIGALLALAVFQQRRTRRA